MAAKPALQKILRWILYTESEDKHNYKSIGIKIISPDDYLSK
jgi:hypothetical protein